MRAFSDLCRFKKEVFQFWLIDRKWYAIDGRLGNYFSQNRCVISTFDGYPRRSNYQISIWSWGVNKILQLLGENVRTQSPMRLFIPYAVLNFANNFATLLSPLPKWLLAAKEAVLKAGSCAIFMPCKIRHRINRVKCWKQRENSHGLIESRYFPGR